MNILVTGGAGFIGSHVVEGYLTLGHKVWVVDDESTGKKDQVPPQARYKKLDICDRASLKHLFQTKKFDVVNHHAAQMDVRKSVQNPVFDAKVNIFGLLNLLEACKVQRVKKFIFSASGGTVYGECKKPALESSFPVPLSPYGISKLAGEKYIAAYGSLYGMKFTIFRYGNVYGPRQDPHGEAGVVAIFSRSILEGKRPKIYGNGRQTRDFVYVSDVVSANMLALNKGHNQVINIGTGKETSVNELFRVLAQISCFRAPALHAAPRPGELLRSVLSISHAKQTLGWTPQMSLEQGLRKTIASFQNKFMRSGSK